MAGLFYVIVALNRCISRILLSLLSHRSVSAIKFKPEIVKLNRKTSLSYKNILDVSLGGKKLTTVRKHELYLLKLFAF